MKQPIKSALALSSAVVAVIGLVLAPVAADAASTTTVTAVVSGSASVSSTSTTVSLPITPTVSGSFTAAADTVVAGTNNPTGYKLLISGTPTALTKGADSIAASSSDSYTHATTYYYFPSQRLIGICLSFYLAAAVSSCCMCSHLYPR